LPERTCLEPPRGHKWTFVLSRSWIGICANAAVRCQVEEGILLAVVMALPARPALVRLITVTFSGGPGPDVDFDDALEEFAGCALYCSLDSPAVPLPRVSRTGFVLLLSGAYSRNDLHPQLLCRVRCSYGRRSCSVRCAVPFLRCRIIQVDQYPLTQDPSRSVSDNRKPSYDGSIRVEEDKHV